MISWDDPNLKRVLDDILQHESHYRQILQPRMSEIVDFERRYYTQKDDRRSPYEKKWRAHYPLPWAYSTINTLASGMSDLLLTSDPPIQAEGMGAEDSRNAKAIEKHLDYTLRRNSFNRLLPRMLRTMYVQGTAFGKVRYERGSVRVQLPEVGQEELDAFEQAVRDGVTATGVPAPMADPDLFDEWRRTVMQATEGRVSIPPIPMPSRDSVRSIYEGPVIERVPVFSLRFDPFVEELSQQPLFIHRIEIGKEKLMQMADDDETSSKPYWREAVEYAINGMEQNDWKHEQREIAEFTGVNMALEDSPNWSSKCVLWECYLQDQPDFPFCVVLNKKAIINKHPDRMPFSHGMVPFFRLAQEDIDGQFLGLSALQPVSHLIDEGQKLRELRMDAVVLAALPIYTRLISGGFSDDQLSSLIPGDVIPVRRPDAIKTLEKGNPGILEAFREIDAIRGDLDDTEGTWSNVRGASAVVNRVTATDAQGRLNQALVRTKVKAGIIEEQLNPMVMQVLGLWWQFSKAEVQMAVGGANPYLSIPKEHFYDAMFQDYRFRGATRAINGETTSEKLTNFAKAFGQFLRPQETREVMKLILEGLRIKDVGRIVTDRGTEETVAALAPPPPQGMPGMPPGMPAGMPQAPQGMPPA